MFETGISVACEVTKGMFSSEYSARIRMSNGDLWNGVIDKEMVIELTKDPTEEGYVAGRIYAYLVSFDEKSALIDLPTEEASPGRRIFVDCSVVRKERIPA